MMATEAYAKRCRMGASVLCVPGAVVANAG